MIFALYNGMEIVMFKLKRVGKHVKQLGMTAFFVFMLWPGLIQAEQSSKFMMGNETFAYAAANENNQGQSFETRLFVSTDLAYENNHITGELQGEGWLIYPIENSVWGHISNANVGYQYRGKADYFFKVGRVLPEWGSFNRYSPIQKLFPQFYVDPFETKTDGWVGGYAHIQENLVDLEVMLSPIFIPSFGGPTYDYRGDGSFYSPSRWALPFYYQATIAEAPVPLKYTLHYPEDIMDILFRPSGAVRLSLRDFFDGYKISALVMHGPDPMPRLRIQSRLDIIQEKSFEGDIHLFPEFYNQTAYGFEFRAKRHGFDLYFESVYRVPENQEDMEEYMVKSQEWNHVFAIQTKHDHPYWPQTLLGISSTYQFDPYKDPYFKLPAPSLHNFLSRLEWKINPQVDVYQSAEWSVNLDQAIFRNGLNLNILPKFQVSGGLDVIMGTNATYFGYFRQHDRLWLKGTYAF